MRGAERERREQAQEKQYPGIVTDFLQKARERTPRGLQIDVSTRQVRVSNVPS